MASLQSKPPRTREATPKINFCQLRKEFPHLTSGTFPKAGIGLVTAEHNEEAKDKGVAGPNGVNTTGISDEIGHVVPPVDMDQDCP